MTNDLMTSLCKTVDHHVLQLVECSKNYNSQKPQKRARVATIFFCTNLGGKICRSSIFFVPLLWQ